MPRVAPAVPEESALLCEKCGYIVNGIATDSRCPECASPIAESLPQRRLPPLWERTEGLAPVAFLITTAQVIFTPSRFFRSITPRGNAQRSRRFAATHQFLSSLAFGAAAYGHALWSWPRFWQYSGSDDDVRLGIIGIILFTAITYILFILITALASRLTAWEAAYRGLRLPRQVVVRALHYHCAHYVPVAILTFATIWGFLLLIRLYPAFDQYAVGYLYILCGEVIVAAAYLFFTYWAGMRNMMFANS